MGNVWWRQLVDSEAIFHRNLAVGSAARVTFDRRPAADDGHESAHVAPADDDSAPEHDALVISVLMVLLTLIIMLLMMLLLLFYSK
jgi:hypothetical protein